MITYDDKDNTLPEVDPARNWRDVDCNEVKSVVNTNEATLSTAVSTLSTHTANTSNPHTVTKSQVGLGNVDNTSDATKNAATVTLTNKTLTSPVINSPTGLVKGDVGLGNVDNTSDANKPVSTAQQTAIDGKVANNLTASTTVAPSKTAVNTALALVPLLASFVDGEVPTGLINGVNNTYTIANVPISGSVKVYWNGMKMRVNVGYTISSQTITMAIAPELGDSLETDYRK